MNYSPTADVRELLNGSNEEMSVNRHTHTHSHTCHVAPLFFLRKSITVNGIVINLNYLLITNEGRRRWKKPLRWKTVNCEPRATYGDVWTGRDFTANWMAAASASLTTCPSISWRWRWLELISIAFFSPLCYVCWLLNSLHCIALLYFFNCGLAVEDVALFLFNDVINQDFFKFFFLFRWNSFELFFWFFLARICTWLVIGGGDF